MPQNLLVTGSRGGNSPHVTSAQAANYNAGIVGDGQYVMSGLTATMTSPNICHIDPGVASMNGRDVEVPAGGVDVAVDNGTQAQQRHDLVCLRYTAASEGSPEAVELVCIKGTPAASNAQDPAYNNGSVLDGDSPVDMPLYRVSLDGVSVSEPVKLYDQVPSIDSLRDSVSQMEPVVLFDDWGNSLSAGATLSEPAQNFSRIELMFRTDDGDVFTVAVLEPSASTSVVASCVKWAGDGDMFAKTKTFSINGRSVGTTQLGSAYLTGQKNMTTGQQTFGDFIAIVKVVGWR